MDVTDYSFWKIKTAYKSWHIGLFLLLIFSIVRFYLVLNANQTGSYQYVSLIFVAMIFLPFLLLTKNGRQSIGLKAKFKVKGLVWSIIVGVGSASVIFLGSQVFSISEQPYHYIAKSYNNLPDPLGEQRLVFFLLFSTMSMIFSPLGEEFFYRGLIHECFNSRFSAKVATVIDSSAFALVHLAHFGIVYADGDFKLLPIPSILWVIALFFTCLGFNRARREAGSIWGAVVAHAIFNLTMNYFIFYHILP